MSQKRWQQVKEILEHALDLKPADRAVFLEEACRADSTLREEVDALLASATSRERLDRKPINVKVGEQRSQRSPAPLTDAPADTIATDVSHVTRSCAECGTMIPGQATLCPHCASELAAPSAQLPSVPGSLRDRD